MHKAKLSLNQEAVAAFARVLVALIIVGVVGYAEVMFLQVMSRVFPDGILKIVSMLGAVATGASVLVLLVAKSYWFRPGKQMVFAWAFTGMELLVLVLNVILSFTLDGGGKLTDSYLSVWQLFMPASPILALLGWILILNLDQSQQDRHAELEIEVEQRQAEREHERAVHMARMELKSAFLKSHMTYLQEEANSPEVQRQIQIGASMLAAKELSELTGLQIAPRLAVSPGQVVPALPASSEGPELLPAGSSPAASQHHGSTGPLPDEENWLARVNAAVEQERQRRFEQERDGQADETQVQTLVRALLPVAEQHRDQLTRMESMIGVNSNHYKLSLVQRVRNIIRWAFENGYSSEDVMQLAARYLGVSPASSDGPVSVLLEEDGENERAKKNGW